MGIVVIGDVFIDIKGFSTSPYIPYGRNAGTIAQIHGGVGRNVAEDIANVELEPTFVSSVDDDAMGEDVIRKLDRHKVNTKYMKKVKNGMGTWLAVFDHEGDVVASISKRPNHKPIEQILDEHGDEIFKDADSIVIEIDIDREIVKKTFHYAEKYKKKVYAIVSNGRKRFCCQFMPSCDSSNISDSRSVFNVLFYLYIDRNIHGNDCSNGTDRDQCGTGSTLKCCDRWCSSDRRFLFWR